MEPLSNSWPETPTLNFSSGECSMHEIYYVDIRVALSRYAPLLAGNREGLREMDVSLPIRDKIRAEEMMDHFAKRLKEVFEEVADDKVDSQAAQTSGVDGLRVDGSGDDGSAPVAPTSAFPRHVSPGCNTVGSDLQPSPDVEGGAGLPGKEEA